MSGIPDNSPPGFRVLGGWNGVPRIAWLTCLVTAAAKSWADRAVTPTIKPREPDWQYAVARPRLSEIRGIRDLADAEWVTHSAAELVALLSALDAVLGLSDPPASILHDPFALGYSAAMSTVREAIAEHVDVEG
jgi:crotonobetainyl-CoA:carnitine CoA-transferase CaiB-like acyl-CoA transferase